jgi:multisubunit Na+/H+ antiporter MnhC subunit
MWWWLLCCVPVFAVGIYAGWKAEHIKSVFLLSFIGVAGYVAALQFTGQGFHDVEPGTSHHYMQLAASSAAVFAVILIIVGLGWISHVLLRVRSA